MQSVNRKKTMSRRNIRHDKFIERIRKTFYFGYDDSLDTDLEISRPLAEYSAELFSFAHRGHSLNRLHSVVAGSVRATPCSLLLALIYLDRLNSADPTYLRRITPQELFIVSMMISTKFHKGHDELICIADWAKDGNLSEKRLKRLELDFLSVIDWNIYVSNQEFFEKLEHVELQLALREGLKRGWLTYTELMQMLPKFTLAKFLLNHLTLLALSYTASLVTLTSALMMVNQLTASTTTNILSQNQLITPANETHHITVASNGNANSVLIDTIEGDIDICSQDKRNDVAESDIKSFMLPVAEVSLNEDDTVEDTLSTNWNSDFLLELYKSVYYLDSSALIYKPIDMNETWKHANQTEGLQHHGHIQTFHNLCSQNYTLKNCQTYRIFLEMVKMFFDRISIF